LITITKHAQSLFSSMRIRNSQLAIPRDEFLERLGHENPGNSLITF
jgi:hypothetical protein